ncbi:MAG: N(5)-(carboxyethyl)ornithine synthase [Eubacteriales bacterium]|nr:N(5)-(carboxyethyl)ornithine synthase [Eubacteriales bacterium]MDD3866718.1 N(5)-(carboxyethyl)ornithine synthase [Eubacteriales bacterium]
MKTIGFMKSRKENERRRAILPDQLPQIHHRNQLYFETGYGQALGFSDEAYLRHGVHIAPTGEILRCDIVSDVKIGDADYLDQLHEGQTMFGYVHALQNKALTDQLIRQSLTVITWEDMFQNGRNIFWRNNELAGEAAVMHAFTLFGRLPYECRVALLGRGNTSHGAYRILAGLGADVVVYNRKMEALLRQDISQYDVIVNCVLWDTRRRDHIIYREDLRDMKQGAMIIDVSCDEAGAVETSRPTTIDDPVYLVDGILHYVVDHTPSLVAHAATRAFGKELTRYLDLLAEEKADQNKVLSRATIIRDGQLLDQTIADAQDRRTSTAHDMH